MEAINRTFFWSTGDHISRESLTFDAKILSLSLIFSTFYIQKMVLLRLRNAKNRILQVFSLFVSNVLLTLMLISSVSDLWFYPLPVSKKP